MSNKKITIKPAQKKQPPNPEGGYWKILVIDDDPSMVMITEHILKNFTFQSKGIKTFSAKSFQEASEIYDQNPDAAVAFIDVIMDTADAGLKLVKHIREECNNDRIQLVLRTGQPGNMDQRDILLGYSINDYLNKGSITAQNLQDNLISYLRNFEALKKLGEEKSRVENMLKKRDDIIRLLADEIKISESLTSKLAKILHENQQLSDEDQLKYIKLLISCDDQMIFLMRDFLDSSQLERGSFTSNLQSFYLHKNIHELESIITTINKQLAEEEKVAISIAIDSELPKVLFDPERCQQITINLILNCLQRTQEGKIEIGAKKMHNYICLSIVDRGHAISGAELQQLIDPNRSCSTETASIRLSLNHIKCMIQAMNGTFEAGNNLGDGSYFKIMVPIAPN